MRASRNGCKLGQLQDALLRNARFIVGIKLHTGEFTFEQAVDFFVNEGYQSRAVGTVETKRGTADPTYLYYTLGKLQILKLRADVASERRHRVQPGEIPRRVHAAGIRADQDRAPRDAGERFADVVSRAG